MKHHLPTLDTLKVFERRLEGYGYAIEVAPARYVNQKLLALRNWLIKIERRPSPK
ncbi:MAG: hypothetical protein GWP56_10850 [Gammaproteobacteria bacterium]|jgi:hypothetical protein|nr:hypothetical protein [Gammaproteobacteria bacterium]